MTVADGYAVQRAIIARKVARGDRAIGNKMGLTSKANQDVFGVYEPVYGQLLARGVHLEDTPVQTAQCIQTIIECEITLELPVMPRRFQGIGVLTRGWVRVATPR
jgi:2-keto-4-pentenoate hydratase